MLLNPQDPVWNIYSVEGEKPATACQTEYKVKAGKECLRRKRSKWILNRSQMPIEKTSNKEQIDPNGFQIDSKWIHFIQVPQLQYILKELCKILLFHAWIADIILLLHFDHKKIGSSDGREYKLPCTTQTFYLLFVDLPTNKKYC